jgi:hypothetical protein
MFIRHEPFLLAPFEPLKHKAKGGLFDLTRPPVSNASRTTVASLSATYIFLTRTKFLR